MAEAAVTGYFAFIKQYEMGTVAILRWTRLV